MVHFEVLLLVIHSSKSFGFQYRLIFLWPESVFPFIFLIRARLLFTEGSFLAFYSLDFVGAHFSWASITVVYQRKPDSYLPHLYDHTFIGLEIIHVTAVIHR